MKMDATERKKYEQYIEDLRYQRSIFGSNYALAKLEGEKNGVEKGKIEGKIEIAKNMKAQGMTTDMIQQLTGLNAEEINKI